MVALTLHGAAATRHADPASVGVIVVCSQGGGRTDLAGVGLGLATLVCEVGFSLLAVPVRTRITPLGVAAYTTAIAALMLTPAALLTAHRLPDAGELAGIGYLAVVATAVAFVLWYRAVARLGAERAGLLCGTMPIGALLAGVLLGTGSLGLLPGSGSSPPRSRSG